MKQKALALETFNSDVALLVSAWIETLSVSIAKEVDYVALLVSAWIETGNGSINFEAKERRTPRECVD